MKMNSLPTNNYRPESIRLLNNGEMNEKDIKKFKTLNTLSLRKSTVK